jgi:hypothetical protein
MGQGDYTSVSQRQTLTNSTVSNWYIPLKSFVDVIHPKVYNSNQFLRVDVYLSHLYNLLNLGTWTGTVSDQTIKINSASLICRYTQLTQATISRDLSILSKGSVPYLYHKTLQQILTVNAGVSTMQMTLPALTGNISWLYFIIKPTSSIDDALFSYTQISNFALLDSNGSNIVGGTLIPDAEARGVFGKWWTQSSYLYDPINTYNNNTVNSFVYIWSFSSNNILSATKGSFGNAKTFTGAEQLQIGFTSTLTTSYNIFVYAQQEYALNYNTNSITTSILPPSNA